MEGFIDGWVIVFVGRGDMVEWKRTVGRFVLVVVVMVEALTVCWDWN